ncbi:MAG: amidohydrolase family protein [Marinilabiliaceae bacterium]|nr:amidohydrolase family protein [Marinilabiliaceae bacterium]
MKYLIIKNGLIVSGNKVHKADVLFGNTKILEIKKVINRPVPETPVIDAGGRFLLPGAIDISHHEFLEYDVEEGEMNKLLSSEVSNGTTTLFETLMPLKRTKINELVSRSEILKKHHIADYAFHLSPSESKDFTEKDVISSFVKNGISSFAIQPANTSDMEELHVQKILKAAEKFNLTLIVELNEPEPTGSGYLTSKNKELNDTDYHLLMLETVLEKLKDVNFPVLISKLRFNEEAHLIRRYQERNNKIYAEVEMPCFLGEKSRFEIHEKTMLGGLELKGKITPISTKEFCKLISLENFIASRPSFSLMIGNTKDSPVFNRPDKYFGLKYFSSMLYTLTVVSGNLAITDFVSCMSTRPAKLMGLYPMKGIIKEGSDADIVIWNPDFDRNLYCNIPVENGIEELKLQGRTEFVFAKGRMVYDGEVFYRENLDGQYLYRNPFLV